MVLTVRAIKALKKETPMIAETITQKGNKNI